MSADDLKVNLVPGFSEPTVTPQDESETTPMSLDDFVGPKINSIYCSDEYGQTIKDNLADDNPDNDKYNFDIPLEKDGKNLGVMGLSVEFSKGEGEEVSYKYTLTTPNGQGNVAGTSGQPGAVFKDATQQNRYAELSARIVDPLATDKERKEAENELRQILDDILRPLRNENGVLMYSNKELRQMKNGIIADIKAKDSFEHTTVFPNKAAYDRALNGYKDENGNFVKGLKKLKDDARLHIQTAINNGDEPDPADIATLKTQYSYVRDEDRGFVANRKDIFYTDGKFDSDKFKKFAKDLCHNDYNLTVAERSSKENMFAMYANDKAREAMAHMEAGTASSDDIELVRKTQRRGWFNGRIFEGPTRKFHDEQQSRIVEAAGLRFDTDYRPLLALAEVALAVGAGVLADSLIEAKATTSASASITANADGIPFVVDSATGYVSAVFDGTVTDVTAKATATAFAEVTGTTEAILTGMAGGALLGVGFGTPEAADGVAIGEGQTIIAEGEGQIECKDCNEEDATLVGCATYKELPCEEIEIKFTAKSLSADDAKSKLGDKYDENQNYAEGNQMWQFYDAFGVYNIKDKKVRQAVIAEIQRVYLNGNNALKSGTYKFEDCGVIVNDVEYKFDKEVWAKHANNLVAYPIGGQVKQTNQISSMSASAGEGEAHLTITTPAGKVFTYEVNGKASKVEAIKDIVEQVRNGLGDTYAEKARAYLESCETC